MNARNISHRSPDVHEPSVSYGVYKPPTVEDLVAVGFELMKETGSQLQTHRRLAQRYGMSLRDTVCASIAAGMRWDDMMAMTERKVA